MKLKNIILSTALLVGFCACDDLFEPAIENHKTVEDLEKVMKEAAKNLDFLQAAQYRDEILRLQAELEQKTV